MQRPGLVSRSCLFLSWALVFFSIARFQVWAGTPFLRLTPIFSPEGWHNHGSCIVETPKGDLITCWFHGSGERKADDVIIEGARLRKGSTRWGPRFLLSDTPGYSDGNPCLFVDPQKRLWLFHTTILAHTWESALLKSFVSIDYDAQEGAPKWQHSSVVHISPGPEFQVAVQSALPGLEAAVEQMDAPARARAHADDYLAAMRQHITNELYRRLGWMTRAHPVALSHDRWILPLYHDGFSFSLMAISDDSGRTWHASTPLVGAGNIQPSIAVRRDGSLYTLMRDNGPPPGRLMQADSRDRGETWGPVTDSVLENPGSGSEIITLRNGDWMVIGNDTERGRHSLVIWLSVDEGKTWRWKRAIERRGEGQGSFHYPSLIEAADGTFHASYSEFLRRDGREAKTMVHAHFNRDWVVEATP